VLLYWWQRRTSNVQIAVCVCAVLYVYTHMFLQQQFWAESSFCDTIYA
jgi:hypothetical protein